MGTVYNPNGDDIELDGPLSGHSIIVFTNVGYYYEFTTPTITNGTEVLVFELSASDGVIVSKDTVSIMVQNSRPIANAGLDQVATNGISVYLNAGGSSDLKSTIPSTTKK